jgi:hypothetical protein
LNNQHILRGFCADQAELSAAFGIGKRERLDIDPVLLLMIGADTITARARRIAATGQNAFTGIPHQKTGSV